MFCSLLFSSSAKSSRPICQAFKHLNERSASCAAKTFSNNASAFCLRCSTLNSFFSKATTCAQATMRSRSCASSKRSTMRMRKARVCLLKNSAAFCVLDIKRLLAFGVSCSAAVASGLVDIGELTSSSDKSAGFFFLKRAATFSKEPFASCSMYAVSCLSFSSSACAASMHLSSASAKRLFKLVR